MTTTFQAVVFALINSLTEILPLSSATHSYLLELLLKWQAPDLKLAFGFQLGILLAFAFHLRYDLASMTAGVLSVFIFRRKPASLDEKIPFVIFVGVLLVGAILLARMILRSHNMQHIGGLDFENFWLFSSASPFAFGILLLASGAAGKFFENWSKKNKSFHHWSWTDAFLFSLVFLLGQIPAIGLMAAGLVGAFLRNHRRDSAAQFMIHAYFLTTAIDVIGKQIFLGPEMSLSPVSALTYGLGIGVSFFTTLFAIQLFQRVSQQSFSWYWIYRMVFGVGFIGYSGYYFWANHFAQ